LCSGLLDRSCGCTQLFVTLDVAKGKGCISTGGSRVACYVIPTDEELMIARHTLSALRERTAPLLKEKHA